MKTIKIIQLFLLLSSSYSAAHIPITFFKGYDALFSVKQYDEKKWNITCKGLWGLSSGATGYNGATDKVQATQIYNTTQNALAMVRGNKTNQELINIAQSTHAIDGQNGVRGHFNVTGKFAITNSLLFGFDYSFNKNWWMHASIGYYKMELNNVVWTDQTKSLTADDQSVKILITDQIAQNALEWGGLNINGWSKNGFGDLTFIAGYTGKFKQYKPWIKQVNTKLACGFGLPTGVKKNENKILSMPFGNDGSVSIIVNPALDINLKEQLNIGIDLQLTHIFSNTRYRRIKTDTDQTDLLLLTKTMVQKDPGFTQKFTLYCEPKLCAGFSAFCAYQHVRCSTTHYSVVSNDYSSIIANTAESLKEFTTHAFVGQLKWNEYADELYSNKPVLNIYYVHPFNGTRSIANKQIGAGISFRF